MDRKYFGTDGVRGLVGKFPITAEFAMKLGWAAGKVLGGKSHSKVLIGKDTRRSGYLFEAALEAGFLAAGVDVYLLGPLPTPAIAYLTKTFHAEGGVVISASHNPHYDNGIKFFSKSAEKLPDEIEIEIEKYMDKDIEYVESNKLGSTYRIEDAQGRYIEFCKSSISNKVTFDKLKIVVDCANGATYHIAPSVLRELGAEVIEIGTSPNGLNINDHVGSVYPEVVAQEVIKHSADVGLALDGDGDRIIMVDHTGKIIDGDDILYLLACHNKKQGTLGNGGVVGTVMTNYGTELAFKKLNIPFIRSKVGDRYVYAKMKELDWQLGGEASGHIIYLNANTTGDGIIAALQVLAIMVQEKKLLTDLLHDIKKTPQKMINVPLKSELSDSSWDIIRKSVTNIEQFLGESGRVVLRLSGTEPVLRVMVEAVESKHANSCAKDLAEIVENCFI